MKTIISPTPGLIRVYDLDGKMVMASTQTVQASHQSLELNTSKLNAGIYFVQISGEGRSKQFQLTVSE